MTKNRFVIRLSAADSALLKRLRESTNLTRKNEIVHAALFHFRQFWQAKSDGARVVLIHPEKQQEFTIHFDWVSTPGPDDLVMPDSWTPKAVRNSQTPKVISHEFALSNDGMSMLDALFKAGVAPTQSQVIREALALYASIVQYLAEGWKAFFRSNSDIPIVICGVQEMETLRPIKGENTAESDPVPAPEKARVSNHPRAGAARSKKAGATPECLKLFPELVESDGIAAFMPSGEESGAHAFQG